MRFATAYAIAVNIIVLSLCFGYTYRLFFFSIFGQLSVLAIGLLKERSYWPFQKKGVMWPFAIVGFLSFSAVSSLWNAKALDPMVLAIPIVLAVAIGAFGHHRGWTK